jgi:hypothetical protein
LCGSLDYAEMDDFSPVMVKHDQGIQDPKRRGRDHEHVDRHGVSQVVVQKAAPSWGRGLGASRQIPPNRGLADIDAELEQFAMDARWRKNPPRNLSIGLVANEQLGRVTGRAGAS